MRCESCQHVPYCLSSDVSLHSLRLKIYKIYVKIHSQYRFQEYFSEFAMQSLHLLSL